MKTIHNFKALFILLIMGLTVNSCVTDDEFETPPIEFKEPDLEVNFSIAKVKDLYTNSGAVAPLLIEDSLVLEGYVVSSDRTGNFYKELIIQSNPENPEAGISIQTEVTDLYAFFEPGRKVYVELAGMYVGVDGADNQGNGGVISLGGLPFEGGVGRLSEGEFNQHVSRSGEVVEIVPTVIPINQASSAKLNTLVKFEQVKFADKELGEHYGNLNDTFSVNRTVESCETGETIIMRNSGFANFKNELLPEGSGHITAVLSRFNDDFQVYIRSTEDVVLDQERCEEEYVGVVVNIPYQENFESLASTGPGVNFVMEGWLNVNLNDGDRKYEARDFDDNKYAQITAFNSGENPVEAWLVSPGIDLTNITTGATLNFDTKDGFNNGEGLKVYISTDFEGDVDAATWTELSAAIATGTASGYAASFTPSGNIDLSSYVGQIVNIGFEYLGGDGGVTTTYQIDNFEVVNN